MWKTYLIFVLIILLSILFIYLQKEQIQSLEQKAETLERALSGSLQAAKEKEKRSEQELRELKERLVKLEKLNKEWLTTPLPVDVLEFLYGLTEDGSSPVSAVTAK